MNHLQLTVVVMIVFTTFGTVYAQQDYGGEISIPSGFGGFDTRLFDYDKYDLNLHKDTNGFSPNFLEQPLVKINCASAYYDGVILGYCSQELGTLHELHFNLKVMNS